MSEKNIKQVELESTIKQLSTPRINDVDKEILRSAFAGRIDVIYAIRNVMFGQATDEEKDQVREIFRSAEVRRVVRKCILPELAPDDPLKQSIDLWQTIKIEGEDDDRIKQIMEGRALLIGMLDWALDCLADPDQPPVKLKVTVKQYNYPQIIARNTFIQHVESQLLHINIMANTAPETEEERIERLKKDSMQ